MCPECWTSLEKKGLAQRCLIDTPRHKRQEITFRLAMGCVTSLPSDDESSSPGCASEEPLRESTDRCDAIEMDCLYGVPVGRISEYPDIGAGSLVKLFQP